MEETKENQPHPELSKPILNKPIFVEFVDSHTHPYDYSSEEEIKAVINQAKDSGMKWLIANSSEEKNYEKILKLREAFPDCVIASYGIHPWYVESASSEWRDLLLKHINIENTNCVGEIGLDFAKKEIDKTLQMKMFEDQMHIALELDKPVSVHCVRAHGEMLKSFKKLLKSPKNKINIIMHSYGGSSEITKALLKLNANFFFSLSMGIVSESRRHFLDYIPLENLLVETDSPYQINTEELQKDKRWCDCELRVNKKEELKLKELNEPKFIPLILEAIAAYKKLDIKHISNQLFLNSLRAFKLK